MSDASAPTKVDPQTMMFAPQVLAAVTSMEGTSLLGPSKKETAINIVMAGAHAAEGVPLPEVQGVALLVEMFFSILKTSGVFKSKPKPPAAAPEPKAA